jgi:SP family general alpha glucoside:H+ symporter-like MFS transporter
MSLTSSNQANSLTVLVIGQAFEGVPWGFFIANSPAYASEVAPLPLRAAVTATLQMSWSIGSIIVAGATYGTNNMDTKWEWRLPLALQWIFPVRFLLFDLVELVFADPYRHLF